MDEQLECISVGDNDCQPITNKNNSIKPPEPQIRHAAQLRVSAEPGWFHASPHESISQNKNGPFGETNKDTEKYITN
jgi:hypothetical protein